MKTLNNYNLLFFGSDIISRQAILPLYNNYREINENIKIINKLDVISHYNFDKNQKTINPIHEFCSKNKIDLYTPIKSKTKENIKSNWIEFSDSILNVNKYDIGIICSYGYMIPSYFIDKFPKGIYVIHPSLLPKYRGAAPIYHTLLNGDKETGVSFLKISKNKFDAGPILLQKSIKIESNWKHKELCIKLGELAGNNIIDFLKNIDKLLKNSTLQNEENSSKAPKLSVEDSFINWKSELCLNIINKFRAFNESSFVNIRTKFNSKIIFIEQIDLISDYEKTKLNNYIFADYGTIWILPEKKYQHNIYVKCMDGFLKISKWRFYDKRTVSGLSFIEKFIDKEKLFNSNENKYIINFD